MYNIFGSRCNISNITKEEIIKLSQNFDILNIQTTQELTIIESKWLNDYFFKNRPEVTFRIFSSFNMADFDLSFLKNLTHIQSLCIDNILNSNNTITMIKHLKKLNSLEIQIYRLDDLTFLREVSGSLKSLKIGNSFSKKLSLKPLKYLTNLEYLEVDNHIKDISTISKLYSLKKISLMSMNLLDLEFLEGLQKIEALGLHFGQIKNLTSLSKLKNLKILKISRLRNLTDISVISKILTIEKLYMWDLPHIAKFPSVDKLELLNTIIISNLKSLMDFSTLQNAPSLKFFGRHGNKISAALFIPVLKNEKLKFVTIGGSSIKANDEYKKLIESYGKIYKDSYMKLDADFYN